MLQPRFAPPLLALTLLAAALLACGDSEETPTPSPSATPAVTSTPLPDTTSTSTPTSTQPPIPTPTPDEQVASTFSIPTDQLPVARFTRSDGTTFELPLEVPPRDEYTIGLSGRYYLDNRGMLFWYKEDVRKTFWMKDTHIDLSIAFVDGAGTIVEIFDMEAESLDFRTPRDVHRYSIEAPLGWYAKRGITAGDTVTLEFEIPEFLRQ